MKLSVFNGSPRGTKSNSTVILNWILSGYGENIPINNLNKIKDSATHVDRFIDSDKILMVLPLYTDTMPSIVMHFFEALSSVKEQINCKEIYYVIHSGFPEGSQSFGLKKLLERISDRLGLVVKGIYIMGSSEGTRLMPEDIQKKKISVFNELGTAIRDDKELSDEGIEYLQHPIHLSNFKKTMIQIAKMTGLLNYHWDKQLKDNGVYKERFARPYINK